MKWPTTPLGDLCIKIGSGATPRGGNDSYKQSGIALVRSMNVHIGRFKPDDLAFIDETQAAKLNNVVLEKDDVLLNITGASVARCCMLDNSVLPARVNQHVCILRPERSRLNSQYLMRFLTSEQTQQKLLNIAGAGATREAITKTEIEKFSIPLPPLAEQKRIAAILDAADALRTKRRESLAQLDALLQSTFLTLFGDPVTNPMGWPLISFHQIGKFISGATPSKERDDFWNGNVPWVSPKDMKRDFIASSIDTITDTAVAETNIKIIEPDHLLIVVRGMILAHSFPVALNTRRVTINQDMKAIRPSDRFLPLYLLQCLKAQKRGVLAMISEAGHGTKKFDQNSMERSNVPAPPLPLQQKFAAIVESVERQKAAQRAHLAELDALFAALQHRAFRGEL
jgi:type I restriction enzyme, S subunit